MLFPIYWMVATAFKPGRDILSLTPKWIPAPFTLENFTDAITRPYFLEDVKNSVIVVAVMLVLGLTVAFLAAVGTARFGFKGRTAFLVMIIGVQMVPLNALIIPLYLMLDRAGQTDALPGVIAIYLAVVLPFMIWTLRGFVANIPVELEESAMIDGCSRVGSFFRITFPLVGPGLVASGLGGVVLYGRNVEDRAQLTALNKELHAERPELVIAIDEEGGDVTRLEATTGSSYPGNLALGAAGDSALTQEVAGAIGSELAEVGIDLDLAPVVDVNTNPQNPVIGALVAGCDALCIGGHLAGEEVVDEIVRAVVAALEQGRLSEDRLAEAASRVDALAAWHKGRGKPAQVSNQVGMVAARRAVRSEGPVRVGREAVVIQLETTRSVAAGDVPWGVAASLAARGVTVTATQDLDTAAGKSVVLVVKDLHRLPEQRQVIDSLPARRPDAIRVEMGVPVCRPAAARAYIATHGSARVCAEAAAEVMAR